MKDSLYLLAFKDLLSKPMLIITFMPIIIILAIVGIISLIFGMDLIDYLLNQFLSYFNLDTSSKFVMFILTKLDFLSWIFKFLFYTVVAYIGWNIAIIVGMIITGFFAPYIVKHVNTHYNLELKGHGNMVSTLIFLGKIILIFAILFAVGLLLFWVPVLNIIFFYLSFYYLFHKMLISDVSSEINSSEEARELKKIKANSIRFHSFLLYLLNNIPFIGILTQTYSIIYMSHFYLRESKKLRV